MSIKKNNLIIYAPNVHTGGGAVLLQSVLKSWPENLSLIAWLDIRAVDKIELPAEALVEWVKPSIFSRLKAEFDLLRCVGLNDLVLCFHGLPPLLKNKGEVYIFQQNRLYFGLSSLKSFAWRTRQRLRFEQIFAYILRKRCSGYWVQTPSMARDLKLWYGEKSVSVRILPFSKPIEQTSNFKKLQWDFLYVADGEAHKNHRRLVEAWVILANDGFKPSLSLTLSSRDASLLAWIQQQIKSHGLKIDNLGQLPHDELLSFYSKSKALIFPSLSESFGLPLIEARQTGLPIVASELDFVRDVCEPVQTFDPNSPTSIARAVRRFIGQADLPLNPVGAADFLSAVLARLD